MEKRKKRRVKMKLQAKVAEKGNGKSKAALILSIIAIAILLINGIYYLTAKEKLSASIQEALNKMPAETLKGTTVEALTSLISNVLLACAIVWLVLVVLMAWTTCLLERKKGKWYLLLVFGIIALLAMRFDAGVLAIIASVLYRK